MLWLLLVLALLLGAAAVVGLALRSLYVRGRRLAGELAAASEALQVSLDAIGPSLNDDTLDPSSAPRTGQHGVR